MIDDPAIATKVTSPSPIISAEAVAAVRRGLRNAFSRASWPCRPIAAAGAPISRTSGRVASGESSAAPSRVSTAPIPTGTIPASANRPSEIAAIPAATTRPPITQRPTPSRGGGGAATACMASTGATRTARSAGPAPRAA